MVNKILYRRKMTLDNQNISDIELMTYAKANKHSSGMKLRLNEPVRKGLDLSHKDKIKAVLEYKGDETQEAELSLMRTGEASMKMYATNTGMKVYVPVDTAYEIDCPEGEVVKLYILEVNPDE